MGYAHCSTEGISIERTIDFLIRKIVGAGNIGREKKDSRYIFYCRQLIIIAEADRFSDRKIRLIPLQNRQELEKYIMEEAEDESDND